jgi:hypothetical protein
MLSFTAFCKRCLHPTSHRRQAQVDGRCRQPPCFQLQAVPQHDGPTEGQPRLRAVPFDEIVDGERIRTNGFRRSEGVQDASLGEVQVW